MSCNCPPYFHCQHPASSSSETSAYHSPSASTASAAPSAPFFQPAQFPYNNNNSNNDIPSTNSIHPSMFASVEFWASFVQKYEEYRRCLKNVSSGDVVLSKLAVESNRQQHQQQIGSNNNSPLNLSSISPSNKSINSMSSHSPPNYYHHYQSATQAGMTATTPIMDNYSPKPVTSSSPIMNAPSNSSSPVLTIDTQQDCSDVASSATASSYHATCLNCTHMCHSQPKEKYSSANYHLPFDDSFSSTTSADAMTFKDRQKRFNRFVKKRFIDEFGPIEYLSYKMLKRHESSMMDRIKHEARERYLPSGITEVEFKVYWKSALNTIRQTRYRYRSRQQYRY